jgi:hypothetical protein
MVIARPLESGRTWREIDIYLPECGPTMQARMG